MTLYTTFTIVESPLSHELEPSIRIRKRDLDGYSDPIQFRMMLVLALAATAVSLFSVLLAARNSSGSAGGVTSIDGINGQVHHEAVPSVAGELSPVFTPEVLSWGQQILRWSADHQLDPNMVATIMQIESCGDPQAVSSAGAQGLFQVMPFHFVQGESMLDPDTNALRGLSYFRQQLQETDGDVYLAFAGYNGGSAASSGRWEDWLDETKRYYIWSKGIFEEAQAGLSTSATLEQWLSAGGSSLCLQAAQRLGLQ